ncbi:MAG: glycosyltransferase family 2 protein [Calditrichaeota bacterium]|nr:glycosyltransferase family 2 protein [Calditrichota bacterium]
MSKPGSVIVIAPVWNEAGRVGPAVKEVPRQWVDEVVVVDDGSQDGSADEAAAAGATVIRHATNRGVGAAIRTGFDYALRQGFHFLAVMSGGGKTPASQLPLLLGPLFDGASDFVQGSRYLPGGRRLNHPAHRQVGTRAYSLLFSVMARRRVTDGSCGFRALRAEVLRDRRINLHQPWLDRYELEPYLYFMVLRLGYRVKEVPVTVSYPLLSNGPFTKMRGIVDWWSIARPLLLLGAGWRR